MKWIVRYKTAEDKWYRYTPRTQCRCASIARALMRRKRRASARTVEIHIIPEVPAT